MFMSDDGRKNHVVRVAKLTQQRTHIYCTCFSWIMPRCMYPMITVHPCLFTLTFPLVFPCTVCSTRAVRNPRTTKGTFSLIGALECSPCPSGFYSGASASVCIPCAVGTYRQQSSASGDCYPCVAGTYAPFKQTSVCLDCPRGYYSESGGAVACEPCPAGTAGANVAGGALADACLDCGAGEFSEEAGLTACEQCQAGTASAVVGADDSGVCQVGARGLDGRLIARNEQLLLRDPIIASLLFDGNWWGVLAVRGASCLRGGALLCRF